MEVRGKMDGWVGRNKGSDSSARTDHDVEDGLDGQGAALLQDVQRDLRCVAGTCVVGIVVREGKPGVKPVHKPRASDPRQTTNTRTPLHPSSSSPTRTPPTTTHPSVQPPHNTNTPLTVHQNTHSPRCPSGPARQRAPTPCSSRPCAPACAPPCAGRPRRCGLSLKE